MVNESPSPLSIISEIEKEIEDSSLDEELPQRLLPLSLLQLARGGAFEANDKGVVAAFSPSGLSVDAHAEKLHQLLLDAALYRGHERLRDAVIAAQRDYAALGRLLRAPRRPGADAPLTKSQDARRRLMGGPSPRASGYGSGLRAGGISRRGLRFSSRPPAVRRRKRRPSGNPRRTPIGAPATPGGSAPAVATGDDGTRQ